jgi:hypothetical protein
MNSVDDVPDGPSVVRRLALGAVTLFGVYHGLKHLALGLALTLAASAAITIEGYFGLLVAATLAASVVAGTVNRWAEFSGFLLGLSAAGAHFAQDVLAHSMPPVEWLVGVPIVLAIVGVIGGMAGRLMYPPAPTLPNFGQVDVRLLAKAKKPSPKIVWWRISFGVLLAIVASMYADSVRQVLARVLAGQTSSHASSPLLTWQISVLGVVLGGIVAGANTRSGLRQGIIAGFGVASGVIVVEATRGNAGSPVLEFWIDQAGLKDAGSLAFGFLGISVLLATALGGWLGSHLLPPRTRRWKSAG